MRSSVVVVALALAGALTGGAEGSETVQAALRNASDYTFMWWTYGLRDPRRHFSIQTSRFALTFDAARLDLTHLVPGATAESEEAALVQPNRRVFTGVDERNASLRCAVLVDGKRFRAAGGSDKHQDCHLVESGRYFQRRWLDRITWEKGAPRLSGGLEVAAWPDRLALLLRLAPAERIERGAVEITLDLDDSFRRPVGKGDGWFSTHYRYIMGYKGLAFYTKSPEPLRLPEKAELVTAKTIWVPG